MTSLPCPHCRGPLRTRSSRAIAPTIAQMYLICVNPECAATFGGDLTITHVISPGAKPNPAIGLRTSAPRRRPANDEQPARDTMPCGPEVPPANDDGLTGVATG